MNATHAASATAGGVTVTILATDLMYLSHWPLIPLSQDQALAFAATLIGIAGTLWGWWLQRTRPVALAAPKATVGVEVAALPQTVEVPVKP